MQLSSRETRRSMLMPLIKLRNRFISRARRDTRENPRGDAPARTTRRLSPGHLKNLTKSHVLVAAVFLTSDNVVSDGGVVFRRFRFSARLSGKLRIFDFFYIQNLRISTFFHLQMQSCTSEESV